MVWTRNMENRLEILEEGMRRGSAKHEEIMLRREANERGMAEIIRRLDEMARRGRSRSRDREDNRDDDDSVLNEGRNRQRFNPIPPATRRLEIPGFTGEDAFGWLSKVERYFAINGVVEAEKLRAVFRWWEVSNPNATWGMFRRELLSRFQAEMLDNPYRALYTLKQNGSVADFRAEFKKMVGALRFDDEDLLKGAWLNGVRSSIRAELMMSPEISLMEMMKFTIKIERRNDAWKEEGIGPIGIGWTQGANRGSGNFKNGPNASDNKNWASTHAGPNTTNNATKSFTGSTSNQNSSRNPQIKNSRDGASTKVAGSNTGGTATENHSGQGRRLSWAELRDRQDHGLYFECEERWHPHYRCQNRQLNLLLIDGDEEEERETNEEGALVGATPEASELDKGCSSLCRAY